MGVSWITVLNLMKEAHLRHNAHVPETRGRPYSSHIFLMNTCQRSCFYKYQEETSTRKIISKINEIKFKFSEIILKNVRYGCPVASANPVIRI